MKGNNDLDSNRLLRSPKLFLFICEDEEESKLGRTSKSFHPRFPHDPETSFQARLVIKSPSSSANKSPVSRGAADTIREKSDADK